jgi:phosphoribosylformimino-5-aminoimidazole carboxamide ribonucleotide (ProFAR) isomerase
MEIADQICSAVDEGRFLVGVTARIQMGERKIALWQIETGLTDGNIVEVPDSKPHPSILVDQVLLDGTLVVVSWSWLATSERAKLVSVFFPDREKP